ncbi:hypothetical protein K2173_007040 [Erythroxylum novogranatense]|uniref:Uncharacterized protein n=1 Tax=Erythroxylum novogranatense TaxID=1862640 RepID=A0AAV8SLF8_9ROSI|nr:hypothetical protein K2173_007040 [Erythroxylum novogranatense]
MLFAGFSAWASRTVRFLCSDEKAKENIEKMALNSQKWGYVRIITGTIFGGVLGFYVMHRVEVSYKEKMKERLRQYERDLKEKEKLNKLEDSV